VGKPHEHRGIVGPGKAVGEAAALSRLATENDWIKLDHLHATLRRYPMAGATLLAVCFPLNERRC
jgi:hypothetical protein